MKRTKSLIAFTIFLLTLTVTVYAQGPGFDDDTEDVPIDGGVTVLAAAGISYGIKKLKDKKSSKNK